MTGLPANDPDCPRIADIVLGAVRKGSSRGALTVAVVAAMGLHAAVLAVALQSKESLEPWAAALAVRIHTELGREMVVEPVPPPSPPVPPMAPSPPRARHSAPHEAVSRPPPPARAGRIIAREPGPAEPRDLTADTFVTGTADAYAGGVTSSTGTNPNPVESRLVDPTAPPSPPSPPPPALPDLSRPVRLVNDDWRCPWPETAASADVDQTTAVVRVDVLVDGSARHAKIVRDPGMGFGEAAVGCALRERYDPALDALGHPVDAESPPIRVRFAR